MEELERYVESYKKLEERSQEIINPVQKELKNSDMRKDLLIKSEKILRKLKKRHKEFIESYVYTETSINLYKGLNCSYYFGLDQHERILTLLGVPVEIHGIRAHRDVLHDLFERVEKCEEEEKKLKETYQEDKNESVNYSGFSRKDNKQSYRDDEECKDLESCFDVCSNIDSLNETQSFISQNELSEEVLEKKNAKIAKLREKNILLREKLRSQKEQIRQNEALQKQIESLKEEKDRVYKRLRQAEETERYQSSQIDRLSTTLEMKDKTISQLRFENQQKDPSPKKNQNLAQDDSNEKDEMLLSLAKILSLGDAESSQNSSLIPQNLAGRDSEVFRKGSKTHRSKKIVDPKEESKEETKESSIFSFSSSQESSRSPSPQKDSLDIDNLNTPEEIESVLTSNKPLTDDQRFDLMTKLTILKTKKGYLASLPK
ncbi:unnamed protein product [Moneuplotes crassus]|uniref:Uncharacterized protein n=1 Tax=Euplotes crassus TaxID=5936 RepID=A0AAD2D467_EUPCR|nr:unnamed protein product [Moneuplotes crassus]